MTSQVGKERQEVNIIPILQEHARTKRTGVVIDKGVNLAGLVDLVPGQTAVIPLDFQNVIAQEGTITIDLAGNISVGRKNGHENR